MHGSKRTRTPLSCLLSYLTEEVYPYMAGLDTSFDVWRALSQAFGATSYTQQLQLQVDLPELRKDNFEFVSEFL